MATVNKKAAGNATTTLVHALVAAAIVGLATGILDAVTQQSFSWHTAAVTVVSAVATSVVAYLHHAFGSVSGGTSQ